MPHVGSYEQQRQQPDPKRAWCLFSGYMAPRTSPLGSLGCLHLKSLFIGIKEEGDEEG